MTSTHRIPRHSVVVNGVRTSVSLEPEFWKELRQIANRDKLTMNALVSEIDKNKMDHVNLSSACRIEILNDLIFQLSDKTAKAA